MWLIALPLGVLSFVTARAGGALDPIWVIADSAVSFSFLTVGALLVSRLPGNKIGWLSAIGGFLAALGAAAAGVADYGLNVHPGSVPGAIWIAWFNTFSGSGLFLLVGFIALLFPTGHLPSARWRPLAVIGAALLLGGAVLGGVTPFSSGTYPPGVQNPLALPGTAGDVVVGLGNLLSVPTLAFFLLTAGTLVVRYRRATGVEREQLTWLAWAVCLFCLAVIVALLLDAASNSNGNAVGTLANDVWLLVFVAITLMPVAIGIAVLRYHLFEIDRLVSRTISWAIVTAIVGGVFVGFILVFQAVFAPLVQSNELAVAGSTLLAFGLFQPIRRRVQRLVDRRFNRSRHDAEQTMVAFADRLRDQVDLEQLRTEILATVTAAVEPTSVSLWLRE
jgi:hypothetical protein